MKYWGIAALIIGLCVALFALLMTTTAPPPGTYGDVYNLGLLQMQSLTFISGCALAVAGVVLLAAGLLLDRIAPLASAARISGDPFAAPVALEPRLPTQQMSHVASSEETDRRRAKDDRILYWIGGIAITILVAVVIMSLRR